MYKSGVNRLTLSEHVITAIIAAGMSLGGAWITGAFDKRAAAIAVQPQISQVWFDRLEAVEQENRQLRDELRVHREELVAYREQLILLKAENTTMRLRLDTAIPAKQILWDFLDAMEIPAWCKRYDPVADNFPMEHINAALERLYEVTNEYYEGKTDFEIWPEEDAQYYEERDRMVLNLKRSLPSIETATLPDGTVRRARMWKLYVPIDALGEELVCGIAVEYLKDVFEERPQ